MAGIQTIHAKESLRPARKLKRVQAEEVYWHSDSIERPPSNTDKLAWNNRKFRKAQKRWNMKIMMISIVVGSLGTNPKRLVNGLEDWEIRGQVKTIETTALLRSTRILKRVLETLADLLSLKLHWETICQCLNFHSETICQRWWEKLSKE